MQALAHQDVKAPWELVVVDDCSTDDTAKVARAMQGLFTYFKLVTTPRQGGSAYARNFGAQNSCGSLLLFCDADDVVSPSWINMLTKSLQTNSCSAVGGFIDEITLNNPLHLQWRPILMGRGLPIGWWYLPYALTGNLAVYARDFKAIGGFDESLRNGVDVDFSWRLQLSGLKLGYAPEAVVFVRHRDNLLASMSQAFKWGAVSVELVRRFHQPGKDAPRIAPFGYRFSRLAREALKAFRSIGSLGAWLRQCAYEIGIIFGYITCIKKKWH